MDGSNRQVPELPKFSAQYDYSLDFGMVNFIFFPSL